MKPNRLLPIKWWCKLDEATLFRLDNIKDLIDLYDHYTSQQKTSIDNIMLAATEVLDE
jgi:hypothetical protein